MAKPNITPPVRTPLLTQNGAPLSVGTADIQTTRDWWLYWNQLGDQANQNSQLATDGAHADRPLPDGMPDGAIYIESDRGVIYQNQGGVWQYVAGTMYGTISPDQRPTDLGPNDGGFEFRSTDTSGANTGRDFIWSQTAWIEITPVLYGTHAARPAAAAAPARCLYMETDRGSVIYQNQGGVWLYLAGTMWGTLSPDQRPTDLGVHDAGFDFRTTVAPPQEFIWNQTAWVETTSVSGAVNLTHPNVVTKVGSTQGQIVEGGITDQSAANSNTVYINSGGNVAINTTTGLTERLTVNGRIALRHVTGTGAGMWLDSPAATAQIFVGTEPSLTTGWRVYSAPLGRDVLTVDLQSGFVGINTSAPAYNLQLVVDSAAKPATSSWAVVSDLRLKQNIQPVKDDSLAILGNLDWIRYEYNGQANTPQGLNAIGLVAQELQAQLPEAVRSTKTKLKETDADETDVLAIDYHHILVHTARAIQQLEAEVKRLRALLEKPQP